MPELEARTLSNSKQLFPQPLLRQAKSETAKRGGVIGAEVWEVVMEHLSSPPSMPTTKGSQERHHHQDTGKAPRSRLGWLQGCNATGQQDLPFLICRCEAVKQSTKPDRHPGAFCAACFCSTEVQPITRRFFSCWQLEVTGGNPEGMAC